MLIPVRTLRATADNADRNPPSWSERDLAEQDRIRTLGRAILAEHGRHAINFSRLAAAVRATPAALRKFYPDVESLLIDILTLHLRAIAHQLGTIPRDAPNRRQQQRAAYLAATRTPLGGLTEAHLLLVRDRHLLPPQDLHGIEQTRLSLGQVVAHDMAHEALHLLDSPCFDAEKIEAMLAALAPPKAQPAAEPASPTPPPNRAFNAPAPKPNAASLVSRYWPTAAQLNPTPQHPRNHPLNPAGP